MADQVIANFEMIEIYPAPSVFGGDSEAEAIVSPANLLRYAKAEAIWTVTRAEIRHMLDPRVPGPSAVSQQLAHYGFSTYDVALAKSWKRPAGNRRFYQIAERGTAETGVTYELSLVGPNGETRITEGVRLEVALASLEADLTSRD